MDSKSLEKIVLLSSGTLILIPFAIIIWFFVRKKTNKNIELLNNLYEEIENIYLNHKKDIHNFKLEISSGSKEELYNSYDSLLTTESVVRYVIDKKIEANNLISEIKPLMLFNKAAILEKDWQSFNDNDVIENQLLDNIAKEKNKIYQKFKEFSYL